jgi:hypothetical protein
MRMSRLFNKERTVSSTISVGKTIFTCKRMKLDSYLTPHTKINCIKNLKIKLITVNS